MKNPELVIDTLCDRILQQQKVIETFLERVAKAEMACAMVNQFFTFFDSIVPPGDCEGARQALRLCREVEPNWPRKS